MRWSDDEDRTQALPVRLARVVDGRAASPASPGATPYLLRSTARRRGRENGQPMQRAWMRALLIVALSGGLATASACANAATAYITNEKGNSISVIDLDKLEVVKTVEVGQRPRGITLARTKRCSTSAWATTTPSPSSTRRRSSTSAICPPDPTPSSCASAPTASSLFVANENDALLTAIDLATRTVVTEFPVGVEPEGVAVSPDGAIVVNTSETTSMAHFIDWKAKKVVANVLVGARPRYAEFTHDGSELWVTPKSAAASA